ncbi:MAG TPA: SH3 domain-containing protein [Herpetosiphonaceae bacterium]
MPKLPFKRKPADDAASISAYIPSQMVDYTSLPPIEEDTALTRFNRMPLIARIGAILLPILLLVGATWGVWQALSGTPETQAQAPETPVVTISKAQAVSREAIAVAGQTEHVTPGTKVSARLLSGEEAIDWADPEQSTATVENGTIELRMSKADSWEAALTSDITYTVELTVGEGEKAITARSPLTVPEMLAGAFFGPKVEPTPIPSPSPTPSPTPEPTPEPPVVTGPPTLAVVVDSTMLISPTLRTAEIGGVQAGTTFEPMLRSDDSKWFLVKQGEQVGWLHADQIKIETEAAARVTSVRPDPAKVEAGPLKATVFNGGNIRYRPNVETGTVLGQLHARQAVTLSARTADGSWYKVVAPEAEGWVSSSLLTIDPAVAAQVPAQ